MAILNKINVSGTTYDINDQRLAENAGTIETSENLAVAAKITGNEIVENMNGYSAVMATIENLTINPIYIGVVKNGNKITFCCALELTRTDTVAADSSVLVGFNIPSAVGSKLYPTSVGGYNSLTCGLAPATLDTRSFSNIPFRVVKPNDAAIQLACSNNSYINALTANSAYYVRFEFTFLLSDNLAA